MNISDLNKAIDRRTENMKEQAEAAVAGKIGVLEAEMMQSIRSLTQRYENFAQDEFRTLSANLQNLSQSALDTTKADTARAIIAHKRSLSRVLQLQHPWVWVLLLIMMIIVALSAQVLVQMSELQSLAETMRIVRVEHQLRERLLKTDNAFWIKVDPKELIQGQDGRQYLVIPTQ